MEPSTSRMPSDVFNLQWEHAELNDLWKGEPKFEVKDLFLLRIAQSIKRIEIIVGITAGVLIALKLLNLYLAYL